MDNYIKKHNLSNYEILDYKKMILGETTGTLMDNFKKESKEYHKKNLELVDKYGHIFSHKGFDKNDIFKG